MPCFEDIDSKFEYLNLAGRNMSFDELNDFINDLSGDGMILQIDLSDNISLESADNPKEMERLTDNLCTCLEHNRTLLALEFADNNLGYYGPYPLSSHSVDYFKKVVKSLAKSSLTRIDVSGNFILGPSHKILSSWAMLLKDFCKKQCEVLRARNNYISSPALSLITNILGPKSILEELDLNDNFCGHDAFGNVNSEGIYSFTRLLGMSPKLRILKLARNELHDQDIIYLSEAMSAMPGLLELDLAGNYIGLNGMKALKEFIVGHSNLTEKQGIKKLYISKNNFGSDGLFLLNDAMKLNNTITDLDISECGYRSVAMLGLHSALQSNSTLLKLKTLRNRVTKDAEELVHAEVEANNYVKTITRNSGSVNAKKMRLTTKNALAMKLQNVPYHALRVLHDNTLLNEPNSKFQDALYLLCPPDRAKLIRNVEEIAEGMHDRIERAKELDRINKAKHKIFHFVVRNFKRKQFNRLLKGGVYNFNKQKAADKNSLFQRAHK